MAASPSSAVLPEASTIRAAAQSGILDGLNPSVWDPKNPITVFLIQAGIIIVLCRLLAYPLSYLQQPKVIAEVIGGILLGPSRLGRVPEFSQTIFPADSMPVLNAAANLGLIFFLFLVGLEVDFRVLTYNWKIAASVSAAGMVLPFALGAAISHGLYNEFNSEVSGNTVSFAVYLLFIGVAMAITAFPVLCRILTELKLLKTSVGLIVLSAGVGNDVVGWILLALCVALIKSSKAITVLYILLLVIGYTLFVVFAIRPLLIAILRKTGSLQAGPTQPVMALLILLILASAFFTDIIALHPIFGAFLIGLICPHEGGFAIAVTARIEDWISTLLLPLYFALSGLNTNLALLNDATTWAYVVGVTAVAFFGKLIGGTFAAKLHQLEWRESLAVGVFLSCKGLVELIVLNVGLQAGILSQVSFTIFVVMALATTCATTPLVRWLYSESYRIQVELSRNSLRNPASHSSPEASDHLMTRNAAPCGKILLYLHPDNVASAIKAASLLINSDGPKPGAEIHHSQKTGKPVWGLIQASTEQTKSLYCLRLRPITERVSSIMELTEATEPTTLDPILRTFHALAKFLNARVDSSMLYSPAHLFGSVLADRAARLSADLLLIPWNLSPSLESQMSRQFNFFDGLEDERLASLVGTISSEARTNVVFCLCGLPPLSMEKGSSSSGMIMERDSCQSEIRHQSSCRRSHITMLFLGGADDRYGVSLILQMLKVQMTTATIFRVRQIVPEDVTGEQGLNFVSNEDGYLSEIKTTISERVKDRIVFSEVFVSGPAYAAKIQSMLREEILASRADHVSEDSESIVVVGQCQENLSAAMVTDFKLSNRANLENCSGLGLLAGVIINSNVQADIMVVKAKS